MIGRNIWHDKWTAHFIGCLLFIARNRNVSPFLFVPHSLPLKLRRTCFWLQEEIWARREHHLYLQTLWRCCWKVRKRLCDATSIHFSLECHTNVATVCLQVLRVSLRLISLLSRRTMVQAIFTHSSLTCRRNLTNRQRKLLTSSSSREGTTTRWARCVDYMIYSVTGRTVNLSPFHSFRLSRAAWWRVCQERGWSPGICVAPLYPFVCLRDVFASSVFLTLTGSWTLYWQK